MTGDTPPPSILLVCTANQCRSPLAASLFEQAFAARGVEAQVASAGTRAVAGSAATRSTLDAARRLDVDLSGHQATPLSRAATRDADLVIGLTREHVREAVALDAHAWPKTFTLKELVRRGSAVGPRHIDEPLSSWLARVHQGRATRELMGASALDDVEDPTTNPLADYGVMARELHALVHQAVELGWPPARSPR